MYSHTNYENYKYWGITSIFFPFTLNGLDKNILR